MLSQWSPKVWRHVAMALKNSVPNKPRKLQSVCHAFRCGLSYIIWSFFSVNVPKRPCNYPLQVFGSTQSKKRIHKDKIKSSKMALRPATQAWSCRSLHGISVVFKTQLTTKQYLCPLNSGLAQSSQRKSSINGPYGLFLSRWNKLFN